MKRLLVYAVLIIGVIFLLSCNNSGSGDTPTAGESFDLAAAKTAIEARNTEFASFVAKGDSVGLAGLYTSDAKLMGANMPTASGRSGVQTAFSGMFNALGSIGITLTTEEVWGDESLVSEVGSFVLTDGTGNQIDKGKYIVLWKMEDGKWKLHRDIWNSDNPAPPPAN